MSFKAWLEGVWLESRQFERLIPKEALALVPKLKSMARELTDLYYADKSVVPPYTHVAKLPNVFRPGRPIDVGFLTIEEWQRRKYPMGQGTNSREPPLIHYRIPMTGYDTIYHELVHAYDPKLAKGLSLPKRLGKEQDNRTPHEVEAQIAGHIDMMKERLASATKQDKVRLISQLKNWLRSSANKDIEPFNMPELLANMPTWHLQQDRKLWRKFVSSVYNALGDYI